MIFILVIEIRLSMTTFPVRRVIPELPHNYWNISVEREANKARSLMTVVQSWKLVRTIFLSQISLSKEKETKQQQIVAAKKRTILLMSCPAATFVNVFLCIVTNLNVKCQPAQIGEDKVPCKMLSDHIS